MNFILKLLAVLALLPLAIKGILTVLAAILVIVLVGIQIAHGQESKAQFSNIPPQICADPRTPRDVKSCNLVKQINEAHASGQKDVEDKLIDELRQHLLTTNPQQQTPQTQRQIEEHRQGNPNWRNY